MNREDIYKTVLHKLSIKNSNNISLSDVANELGCKKQSLYTYFDSKQNLIDESMEYASQNIKISRLQIDFKKDNESIFEDLIYFYVNIFKKGFARDYLSAILLLGEYRQDKYIGIDDIVYTFETQIFFIFNELCERKRIKDSATFEYLSHIISLSILEMVLNYSSDEKLKYDSEKLISFLKTTLKNQ